MRGVTKSLDSIIQVNSANTHGILLEVVQVLTDLDLNISKAYIASDGGWFMDGENTNLPMFCNSFSLQF
jgi:UTP:GlnB (protein PII) uridylyltransferase